MYETNIKSIFKIFQLRLSEIGDFHGMGRVYIEGQFEEARHQLELQHKIAKELHHDF